MTSVPTSLARLAHWCSTAGFLLQRVAAADRHLGTGGDLVERRLSQPFAVGPAHFQGCLLADAVAVYLRFAFKLKAQKLSTAGPFFIGDDGSADRIRLRAGAPGIEGLGECLLRHGSVGRTRRRDVPPSATSANQQHKGK